MEPKAATELVRASKRLVLIAIALIVCTAMLLLTTPKQAIAISEDFALLADTHLGQPYKPSYKETKRALNWAAEFDNLKAVCVAGDLTDRGSADSYDEWTSLCHSILKGPKRIQALGNHDTGNDGEYLHHFPKLTVARGYELFKRINGGSPTSFTQFETANIITVGGVQARGYHVVTKEMLKQLNSRLWKTAREGKIAIVVCHYPYDDKALNMRSKLMGVLRSYPNVIYVSGHKHRYAASRQCHTAKPTCTTTPFKRNGFSRKTKYSFRSIGVDACSAYRAGNGTSHADSLTIEDSGRITVQKWNLTKNCIEKKWTFEKTRSAVAVKSTPASTQYPRNGSLEYRITFSDGKAYGGVSSGGTFALKPGLMKKFPNIPAGVLVTVEQVSAPKGWSIAETQRIEVGKETRTLTMKSKYSKPVSSSSSRLRTASAFPTSS